MKRFWWIAVVAAVVATVCIVRLRTPGSVAEAKPAEEAAMHEHGPVTGPHATRVSVVKPHEGGIPRTTSVPGTMESFDFADLYAKVSGYVEEQSVDIGSRVKRGDVLAVVNMPELEEEVNRTEASQAQAEAEVIQAEARVNTAKAEYEAATAAITLAEAELEKATSFLKFREIQYQRIKGLFEKNAIDERLVDEKYEQRDAAKAAENSAQASIISSKAQAHAAEARVAQAEADVVDAKAKVRVCQAQVAKAKVFVKYTKIVSAYDGVVTKRNFHVGDFVRAADQGQTLPMFTVARTDKMRIIAQIPERDVPYTNVGDRATVELDALAGTEFHGTVARFANSEDRNTRTMRAEIDLENPHNKLRDGMFGRVTIYVDEASKGMTVPSSSIVADSQSKNQSKKSSVYVVQDGKLKKTPVEIGQDDGMRAEIVSGLNPTDLVVRRPTAEMSDGLAVEVENERSEILAESSPRG